MKTIKLKGTKKQFDKLIELPFVNILNPDSLPCNKKWLLFVCI